MGAFLQRRLLAVAAMGISGCSRLKHSMVADTAESVFMFSRVSRLRAILRVCVCVRKLHAAPPRVQSATDGR
eukprot:5836715-Pleurochrysis_carterae.AAC.1